MKIRRVSCYFIALFGVLFSLQASGTEETSCDGEMGECCQSPYSSLSIRQLEQPRHDASDGKAKFSLNFKEEDKIANKKKPQKIQKNGVWHCLGYNKKNNNYIVLGGFEEGVWLPGKEIQYIDAKTGKWTASKHNEKFSIFAAVPSPDGTYITLINHVYTSKDSSDFKLQVLNTQIDSLIKLPIPPPSPPPRGKSLCSYNETDPWMWGDACGDGYMELDPGIITYVDNFILQISYSRFDKANGRDSRRKVTIYNLASLFKEKEKEKEKETKKKAPTSVQNPT